MKITDVTVNISTCIDGYKAVEKFEEYNKYYRIENIHLIICDFNMIIMNGDVTCQKVLTIFIDNPND